MEGMQHRADQNLHGNRHKQGGGVFRQYHVQHKDAHTEICNGDGQAMQFST